MQSHLSGVKGLPDVSTRTSPSSFRPISQHRLVDGQETYTEHWRRLSRQSDDFVRSSRGTIPIAASPTPSHQDFHVVETPYKPEEIVYDTESHLIHANNSQDSSGPGHLPSQANNSPASSSELKDLTLLEGPRLAHKPTPRRVYVPDPRTEYNHSASAVRRANIKPEPGCCGLCEISSAAVVGSCLGDWLTGVLKITLTSMAACCAAKLC